MDTEVRRAVVERGYRVAAILAVMAMWSIAGCGINRFDHLHDQVNEERARQASELFESVRSPRTGLPARMLANLEAERALRTTVSNGAVEFAAQTNLRLLDNISWNTLRREMYRQLGYRTDSSLDGLIEVLANLDAVPPEVREDFRKRATTLAVAIARLDSLSPEKSNPFGLRNETVNPKVERLHEAYDKAKPKPIEPALGPEAVFDAAVKNAAPVDPQDFENVLGWTRDGLTALLKDRGAGSPDKKADALVTPTDGKSELVGVVRSVDAGQIDKRIELLGQSVTVYQVLVTGERARIALFKKAQKELLARAKAAAESTAPANGIQNEHLHGVINLVFFVHDTITNHWKDEQRREKYLANASELQRLLVKSAEQSRDPAGVYSLVPLTGTGLAPEDLTALTAYVAELKEEFNGPKAATLLKDLEDATKSEQDPRTKEALSEFERAWTEMRKALGGTSPSLPDLLKQVVKASDALSLDLDVLRSKRTAELAAELEAPVKAIITLAASGKASPGAAKTIAEFVLGPQRSATLDQQVEKFPDPETVKAINDALGDIAKESEAASKRLVDLVAGIQKLHEQLHEENVRHFLALSTIATAEMERWTLNGALVREVEPIFSTERSSQQGCVDCALFLSPADAEAPVVSVRSHVLPSLRSLASFANKAQATAPGKDVADSEKSQSAAARLARAYQAVQGFELVTAINARHAAENTIALVSEVDEHSIRVDDLLTTGVELDVRYSLDELVAFHSSGVTDADLQIVISSVQSGLLAWIGARQ